MTAAVMKWREIERHVRQENKAKGLCPCGASPVRGRKSCAECLDYRRKYRERDLATKHTGQCISPSCQREASANRRKCEYHLDQYRRHAAQRHQRLKTDMFNAYGNACACCGETERGFLSVDHVQNDGADERRAFGRGGATMRVYALAKELGYPKDRYRLLCFNCNMGRQLNGGTCPHLTATK